VGTPEELAEFQALSLKVSGKSASEPERARWRELRARLAPSPAPPLPSQLPRQHTRARKKLKVEFAPVATLHSTFTEEVSAGGLSVRTPEPLEPGTLTVVRLELGGPGALTLSAEVAWCRRDGGHYLVGLTYVALREDERERIEAWALSAPPSTKDRT
jgi:hypothetical protein